MSAKIVVMGLLAMACVGPASARMVTDKERLRQQAQQVCYDDVQRLCSDEIPDEDRIQACMREHRAELSPACRRVTTSAGR